MSNLQGFDAATVEPNAGFDVIPAGEYHACIVESELKSTKNGDGKYLALTLQVLNGEFQNRKLFDKLNLLSHGKNKAETERIAKGTLSAICRAVNILTPNDSSELHNKPLVVKVAIKNDDSYGKQNVIRGYKPRGASGGALTGGPVNGTDQPGTQPAASGGRPW